MDKIDFEFPTRILKTEDFAPVQVLALKDYYKNVFSSLIESVIFKLYNIILYIVWKRRNKNFIHR